jgi:hypothetical protein
MFWNASFEDVKQIQLFDSYHRFFCCLWFIACIKRELDLFCFIRMNGKFGNFFEYLLIYSVTFSMKLVTDHGI